MTMLQIYLYTATAIGTEIATSFPLHFWTMPKEFHSGITVIYNVQYLFSTAYIYLFIYIYAYIYTINHFAE